MVHCSFIVLAALLAPTFVFATLPISVSAQRNECEDPLSCYLDSLVFPLPEGCVELELQNKLCISNFYCYGIFLSGVPSEYVEPTTLQFGATGFGTYCEGDYSYGRRDPTLGSVKAMVNETDFDAALFIGKEGEFPVSATFSSCEISSMNVDISFTGDKVEGLAPALEKTIKQAFNKLLCTGIPNYLENNVTSTLVNVVDPMLQYVIASQPSPLPVYNSHYTAWGDSLVSKVKKIVTMLEGVADLKDFLLCMLTPENLADLQQVVVGELRSMFLPSSSVDSSSYSTSQRGDDSVGSSAGKAHIQSVHSQHSTSQHSEQPSEKHTSQVNNHQNNHQNKQNNKQYQQHNEYTSAAEDDANTYSMQLPVPVVVLQKPNFPAGYNTTLSLTAVKLRGLNTLNTIDLLEPVVTSNVTLHSVIGFDALTVELSLDMSVVPTGDSSVSGQKPGQKPGKLQRKGAYTEKLQVTLAMKDVSFLVDLVLAVNAFVLKSYYLDQLSTKSCWLSAIDEINIANMQLHTSITTMSAVQVIGDAGALEHDILSLINNAVMLFVSPAAFGTLTTDVINGMMQGPLRAKFNTIAAATLQDAKANTPCLTHYPYNDKPDWIVWANSTLIKTADFIVNDVLGYKGINKLMSCATNGTGEMALNTTRLQVSLAGLDSFYALKVLSPVAYTTLNSVRPYELENLISLGYCPYVGSASCNPFELLMSYTPAVETATSKLTSAMLQAMSAFNLAISLSNFTMYLNTELKLDKDGLRDTKYSQLSTLGCVGSSFEAIVVENASLSVADARISIDDGKMARNITTLISKVLSALTRSDKLAERNSDIAYKLSVAEETCAAGGVAPAVVVTDDDNNSSEPSWEWELFILVVGCLSALIMLLAAYNYWGRAGKGVACVPEVIVTPSAEETEEMPFFTRLYYRWDCKNSLIFHPHVPLWLRIATPVCILGDIAMFLNSNIAPDAVSVMVKLVIGPKTIDVGSVFDFGLKSTVVDMWDAGVYPLAVLIMFFSGAWPYVKLMSMFYAWVMPPKLLTIESRENVLVTLDILGKWSLIDFFVMILMLCAFYFNIYIGQEIAVNVTVLPKWGFYGFLLATMISLGLGHIILACHRLIVEPKVLPIPDDYCPRESLSSITYEMELADRDVKYIVSDAAAQPASATADSDASVPVEGADIDNVMIESAGAADIDADGDAAGRFTPVPTPKPDLAKHSQHGTTMLIKVTTAGKIAVVVALVLTALFVIAGTFMLTMKFEFKGLVGLMLKDAANVDYSFVTVGTSIPAHSGVPNDFATRWLQASLFLFGQAMPFALLLALLALWLVPMTLSTQRTLFVLAEVLNAWSALDVFCIAIAAALLEIQQFAAFIVGDSCDSINVILAEYMDPILDGDDKCFDVIAELDGNSWILFMAAALLIVVGLPLLSMCSAAIHLRLKLSTQASILLHHMTHGTAGPSVREALCSLSKEQQYSGELFASDLAHPLLTSDDAAGAAAGGVGDSCKSNPETFKPLAPAEATGSTQSDKNSTNSEWNGQFESSPADLARTSTASNSASPVLPAGSPTSSTDVSNTADSPATETLWSRMTWHNTKLTMLQGFAKARLIELSYTPTVVVNDQVLLSTTTSMAMYQQ